MAGVFWATLGLVNKAPRSVGRHRPMNEHLIGSSKGKSSDWYASTREIDGKDTCVEDGRTAHESLYGYLTFC
jgi:hypothetical protein